MFERKVYGGIIRRLRYIAFVGAAFFQNNPDLVAWVNSQPQSEAITRRGEMVMMGCGICLIKLGLLSKEERY